MEKGESSSNLHMRYIYKRRPRGEIPTVGANLNRKVSTSATNFFDFVNTINTPSGGSKTNPPTRGRNINLNLPGGGKNVNLNNDDRYVPISNVLKIMRRVLPPHAMIAEDAKQPILECISEFISFITTEANSRCTREYRKTVTPDDVLAAMASLGFDNYAETLTLYMNKYRAQNLDRGPMPPVVPIVRSTPAFHHRPVAQLAHPPPPPAPPVAPPALEMTVDYVPVPATSDYGYNYSSEYPQLVDYFLQNLQQGGGEGSSSDVHDFDPFK